MRLLRRRRVDTVRRRYEDSGNNFRTVPALDTEVGLETTLRRLKTDIRWPWLCLARLDTRANPF